MKLTFEKFHRQQVQILTGQCATKFTIYNDYKANFQKFHRQHVQSLKGQLATRDCKEGWEANQRTKEPKIVAKRDPSVSIPPGKAFFR